MEEATGDGEGHVSSFVARAPLARRLPRRALLTAAARAGLGAAGLALVGCGNDDDADTERATAAATAEDEAAPTASAPAAPPGPARPGGELRGHIALAALDFFDSHRSQFATTQLFSALQQNKLLRYADINRGLLEADLASLPEIPDEETYVFVLRPGVHWWDQAPTEGRPLSADDVRLNIERQIAAVDAAGDPDPLFFRRERYTRTASLEIVDSQTIVVRTEGPDASYLTDVHAGPWAFIQAPETWQIFGDRLRDDPLNPVYYTGTGPFQIDELQPAERITFRRNDAYFRTQRPYLDRLTLLALTDPAEQEAAYRDGRLDLWTPGDPRALDPLLAALPNQRVSQRPLPFAIQLALSYRDHANNPLRDRRLAQALHLALNRPALLQYAYGDYADLSGPVPWYAEGWALAPEQLATRPGYRAQFGRQDHTIVRQLVAAAAYPGPLPLHLPDLFLATYPGIDIELRDTLSARLGIPVEPAAATSTRILEGLRDGTVSASIGWGEPSTDPDPTASLLRTVHSEGPDNLGGFSDPAIDAALTEMQRSLSLAERQRIFRDTVQPILLSAPSWIANVGHGLQRTLHPPHTHLPPFGFGWDGHLFEDAWTDDSNS